MACVRKIQNKNGLHFICIPKSIARGLNWRYGDLLIFVSREYGEVMLTKVDLAKRPDLKINCYYDEPTKIEDSTGAGDSA